MYELCSTFLSFSFFPQKFGGNAKLYNLMKTLKRSKTWGGRDRERLERNVKVTWEKQVK